MLWLHDKAVINVGEYDTLIVNTDSRGFYRVMYSKKTLENINKLLLTNHESISTRTRARIIDDAFTSAQACLSVTFTSSAVIMRVSLGGKAFLRSGSELDLLSKQRNRISPVVLCPGWTGYRSVLFWR